MDKAKKRIKLSFKKCIKGNIICFIFVTFLSFFISNSTVAHAKETRSWIGDYLNPTFSIKLTDGDVFFNNQAKREEINNDINNDGTTQYSLYDRFGPDIQFFSYCGEIKIQTNIIDKIYTFIADGAEININTVNIFSSGSLYVNNRVYEDRVDICNSTQDPRYVAWCIAVGLGGKASLANFYLGIAKWIEDIEAFFISDRMGLEIISFVNNTLGSSAFVTRIAPLYAILASVLTLFVVINLAKYLIRYISTANVSFGQIMVKVFNSILAFAIMALFITSPFSLLPIIEKIVEAKNSVMTQAMSTVLDNEIVNNSENGVEANLWYINIYDPWCIGTHNKTYEEMYTLFAVDQGDVPASQALSMSDDNIYEDWTDGSLRYSCKYICGDCKVPMGNGTYARNWAALAYSMQSKYHIGAIAGTNGLSSWPNAETTVRNPQLYVDNFRYIDAMLNISEEYSRPGKTTGNIPSSGPNAPKAYGTSNMVPGALLALYRVIVLNIPLLLFSFKAIIYLVQMMFVGVELIANSIKFLVKFDEGPFQDAIKKEVDIILKWILMHVMLMFALAMYATTYSTFVGNLFYLVFCFILYIEAPAITAKERKIKGLINRILSAAGAYIKNKVTGNGYTKNSEESKKYSENSSRESWEDPEFEDEEKTKRPNSNFGYEEKEDRDTSPTTED